MAEPQEDSIILPLAAPAGRPLRVRPVAFVVAVLLTIFFLYQVVGGGLTLLIFGQSVTTDNVQWMRGATMIAQILFLLVPTILLIRYQHGSVLRAIPWRVPKASEVVLAVAAVIALAQVMEGYMFYQDMIPLPQSIAPFVETIKRMIEETYRQLVEAHSAGELLFVVAVVSLTPAICEELLFRGLIQKNLTAGTGRTAGFIVTGVVFGCYHFDPFLLVPLVALGILFSFFMYRSGTILIPMLAHFTNNLLSTLGLYFENDTKSSPALNMFNSLSDYSSTFVFSTTVGFGVVFLVTMYFYIQVTSRISDQEGGAAYEV